MWTLFKEYAQHLDENRKWWLLPIVGGMMVITSLAGRLRPSRRLRPVSAPPATAFRRQRPESGAWSLPPAVSRAPIAD
ncbi:MAG: hypothetical protein HZC55_21285 [Verrucomicrobia bacterium]|nr:hypothetical protein [Verrucomicrobiota bacterium]